MNRPFLLIRLLGGLIVLPSVLSAALVFTDTALTVPAKPGQAEVVAVFTCRNGGDRPVTILRIRSSCGCTTVADGRRTLAAGESSQLPVTMKLSGEGGPLTKTVIIETDRAPFRHELTITAELPVLATLAPRSLIWVVGGPAESRTVRIRRVAADLILAAPEVTDPAFAVDLQAVDDGWLLTVMPKDLSKRRAASILLPISGAAGPTREKVLLNIVEPPPPRQGLLHRLFGRP